MTDATSFKDKFTLRIDGLHKQLQRPMSQTERARLSLQLSSFAKQLTARGMGLEP